MRIVNSVDETQLSVQTWGHPAAPVVVLVHGLGMSIDSWGPVPNLLASDHHVIAYDLRGHGRSSRARRGDYSLDAHADDLAAVLQEVADRSVVLVGNSLGGAIAVHAAHRGLLPSSVQGVVFAGSGASVVTLPGMPGRELPDAVRQGLRRAWLEVLRATAAVVERLSPLEALADRVTRRVAFAPDDPEPAVRQTRVDFAGTRREALIGTMLASGSHNGLLHAGALRVPALVLHGSRDPEVPTRESRMLLSSLPDAELARLPGGAHMLPLTRPADVAEQVRGWVKRTGVDAGARAARRIG